MLTNLPKGSSPAVPLGRGGCRGGAGHCPLVAGEGGVLSLLSSHAPVAALLRPLARCGGGQHGALGRGLDHHLLQQRRGVARPATSSSQGQAMYSVIVCSKYLHIMT